MGYRSKMAEMLTSTRPWASVYPWQAPQQAKADQKRPISGPWPNSWKSPPLSQNSWSNPPTHWPIKLPSLWKLTTPSFRSFHLLGWPKLCLWSVSVQFSSVTQLCATLCDPMNRSTPGLPVHHQLPEFTQTQVHRVSDAIQPSHPLSSPSPLAFNLSYHQGL